MRVSIIYAQSVFEHLQSLSCIEWPGQGSSKTYRGETVRVRNEFMNIVNGEINLIWKNGKDKNIQKVEWAAARNKVV